MAISGWFVGHNLTRRREDRTKRLQITLEHCEKQIAEFYAPLNGLLTQLDTTATILEEMVDKEPQRKDFLQSLVYFKYFLPLHRQIEKILKNKLHLVEGFEIPESVVLYQKHFASENIYWNTIQKNQPKLLEELGGETTSAQEDNGKIQSVVTHSKTLEKQSETTSAQDDNAKIQSAITQFPEQIHCDIRNGLKAVSNRYESCIRELRPPSKLSNQI